MAISTLVSYFGTVLTERGYAIRTRDELFAFITDNGIETPAECHAFANLITRRPLNIPPFTA